MIGVSLFIFIALGTYGKWGSTQYLNNRPFPKYSLEDMPDTDFSCRDKILGGYYADLQTQCQMFHVCVKVAGVGVQDFRFLCPNSTAFDQEHQICADWDDVDCDQTTLYYSSDNFDLYRIGSGFESKAAKYGEEEEPYALQRAETGDVRLNREHQTNRINQQKEIVKNRNRANNEQYHHTNQRTTNTNDNTDKDIFKVSSSSNFFNNRNSGKETDEYDDESANANANQNEDRAQKRKLVQKPRNKPQYDEQTQKPNQPTGFINNFAGSVYTSTARSVSTTLREEQPQRAAANRQRQRGQYQYTDNNFRQNHEDDGQYREDNSGQYNRRKNEPQYTVSTPAPFRRFQQQQRQNTQDNYNNDQYTTTTRSTEQRQTYDNQNNQYDDSQVRVNQNYPARVQQAQVTAKQTPIVSYEKQTQETENYPSTPFQQGKSYPSTPLTYSPTPFKQSQRNSPTPFQKTDTKESETSSTAFRNTQQYTIAPFHKDRSTENYYSTPSNPSTQFKQQTSDSDNYPYQNFYRQKQVNRFEDQSTPTPFNDNTQQYQSNYEITKVKQAPELASTQNFKKPTTFAKPGEVHPTTFSPKGRSHKIPTFSESYSSTVDYKNSASQQNYYNAKQNNYNQQEYLGTHSSDAHYNQQQQTNRQTVQPAEYKQTTQFTHYTPTVPRITTPYYSSTTPAPTPKRSHRFDETQYDDGSYNPKYDNDDADKNEDEVLKTAHSTNFASSKNEYVQNAKHVQLPQTEKPRPFSVTPNPKKEYNITKSSNTSDPSQNGPADTTNKKKKSKDTSYDYAYYDTNVGHEHEYDVGIDIEKSNSAKNRKSA